MNAAKKIIQELLAKLPSTTGRCSGCGAIQRPTNGQGPEPCKSDCIVQRAKKALITTTCTCCGTEVARCRNPAHLKYNESCVHFCRECWKSIGSEARRLDKP